jgi:hypothetical protein
MSDKIRVLVRFRPEIFECFEMRSDYEGTKAGTVANRLLKDEIEKVSRVGERHIIIQNSDEFMSLSKTQGIDDTYYILPDADTVIANMPNQARKRGTKVTANKQVSFYLTEEQIKTLQNIVFIQDIRAAIDCGEVVTYRFAILALLLNTDVLTRVRHISE